MYFPDLKMPLDRLKNKTNVLTLRLPVDLKDRLERQAKNQGISINQLAGYLLNLELTQMETIAQLEIRLASRKIPDLKKKVKKILTKIPDREVPDWDKI
jgi:hypothetical protein